MHFSKLLLDLLQMGQNRQVISFVKNLHLHKVTDPQGQTLLHHAAICGNLEITDYLIKSGCDVNVRDTEGETPLKRCLRVKQYAVAQILLKAGSDVSCLLHSLVTWGDAKGVELLLDHGANIEETNHIGATPLFYVYINEGNKTKEESEKIEILQMLLRRGASLMTCVSRGCFQIMSTLMRGSRQAVRLILQSNVDLNAKDKSEGQTMLHYIAMNRNPGITEELIPHIERFELDALHNRNGSPIREAVSKGNFEMVNFLLDRGARVDFLCHPYGSTVLWSAFKNANAGTPEQYEKCIELLLQHKIDPQATMINNRGQIVTIVEFSRQTNGFEKLKYVIAQIAINEKLSIKLIEPTRSKIHSDTKSKTYLKCCRKLLRKKVDGTVSIFKLLTAPNKKIEKYSTNIKLMKKVLRLKYKQELNSRYKYYYNIIGQRITKAILSKTLRDKAALIICEFLEHRVNETDIITEKIIGHLDSTDLRQLYMM